MCKTNKDFVETFSLVFILTVELALGQGCYEHCLIFMFIPLQLFKSYCAEYDKFYKNNLSHGKNISWNFNNDTPINCDDKLHFFR